MILPAQLLASGWGGWYTANHVVGSIQGCAKLDKVPGLPGTDGLMFHVGLYQLCTAHTNDKRLDLCLNRLS